ncbi:hypothetical protein FRB93_009184 [Tulasnella sp. JGI-2019a]|nr:hypothetical protein FRB93_009184 [Tulasnella sp. JGI-2019a]
MIGVETATAPHWRLLEWHQPKSTMFIQLDEKNYPEFLQSKFYGIHNYREQGPGWFTMSRRYVFEFVTVVTTTPIVDTGLSSIASSKHAPPSAEILHTIASPPLATEPSGLSYGGGLFSEAAPSHAIPPSNGPSSAASSEFERSFFTLTVDQAKELGPYDIIVVGTGIGGGVVARDLHETNFRLGDGAKSVLVIEKGGLSFHSHCLNTARFSGSDNDHGQRNDVFFACFKEEYRFDTEAGASGKDVYGGPMCNVGGRSAVWGLFSPRIHSSTLDSYFPEAVAKDLKDSFYEKAEKLFKLSSPGNKIIHQHLIDRLNSQADSSFGVYWQRSKIASEFKNGKNVDFAKRAYSTIDKLLEIAMSKPLGPDKHHQKHMNFKMLIRTEVRKVVVNAQKNVTAVVVRTDCGAEHTINLKADGKVVLAAGSVASPAILLRSDNVTLRAECCITDHDILYRSLSFRYLKDAYREKVGSMKLQTYFKMGIEGDSRVGLATVSIDASPFLPQADTADKNLPQFIMAFTLPCPLETSCGIQLGPDSEPRVKSSELNNFQ